MPLWIYKVRRTSAEGKQKLFLTLRWREIFPWIFASFYYCPFCKLQHSWIIFIDPEHKLLYNMPYMVRNGRLQTILH